MVKILESLSEVKKVSEGGQKEVYKAKHPDFGIVAVKKGEFKSISSLERIRREVEILKELSSNYFPKNYDFTINLNSKEFIIMEEFIEAQQLNEINDYYNSEEKIIMLLKNLIEGLSLLWERDIVHRDLKPGNILIKGNNQPIIIDLGIARVLDYEDLTETIAMMGPCTPIYASPEQIKNKKEIIDMRTDFFLLGILILELYLGFHPFNPEKVNNNNSIPENICVGKYVDLNNIDRMSDEFKNLIDNLLQIEPFRRFRNYKILSEYINKNWRDL